MRGARAETARARAARVLWAASRGLGGAAERLRPPADPAPAEAAGVRPARDLQAATKRIGDVWVGHPYYEAVEGWMDSMWENLQPYLQGVDYSVVVDLAAGHGRNSTKLLPLANRLHIVDINQENVDFCRSRFGADPRIEYHVNDGLTLDGIADDSVTLVYCNDAMVHFESDAVRSYLGEFRRVLVPGGRGMCHHSNYTGNPGGDWLENPHWRNFMSRELFAHYAHLEGLRILVQQVSDWGPDAPDLDCYSTFERPVDA
jgi:ubiquinone/menaquinone biosynthesis C-methylase UbiE